MCDHQVLYLWVQSPRFMGLLHTFSFHPLIDALTTAASFGLFKLSELPRDERRASIWSTAYLAKLEMFTIKIKLGPILLSVPYWGQEWLNITDFSKGCLINFRVGQVRRRRFCQLIRGTFLVHPQLVIEKHSLKVKNLHCTFM